MDRIAKLFAQKQHNILSIYFTAGFPKLHQTNEIIQALQHAGVDMIEIGIPFSDPMADGLTIQHSNDSALKNGMSLALLLEQLKNIRQATNIPLIMMGYLNPIIQYGFEAFCKTAKQCGIDACIIPDIPLQEYLNTYKALLDQYDLKLIFLITPQTSEERIRLIDSHSNAFIYLVTTSSVTGTQKGFSEMHHRYLKGIMDMHLKNPVIAGFGISNKDDFKAVNQYVNGAIIGSKFINTLKEAHTPVRQTIETFITSIRT